MLEKKLFPIVTILIPCFFAYVISRPSSDLLLSESGILKRVKRGNIFQNLTLHFDCKNRPIGLYADVEYDCQIFHQCDARGNRIPFMCPKKTQFSQQYRVCAWAYDVNCEDSANWYYLNDLTYVTDPPTRRNRKGKRNRVNLNVNNDVMYF